MSRALLAVLLALAACGGGGDSGAVDDPQWTAEDEAEIAELIEIVETLGEMYNRNMDPEEQ